MKRITILMLIMPLAAIAIFDASCATINTRIAKDTTVFKVVVNYNQSLTDMVKAGKFDWTNPDIVSEHFPTINSGETTIDLELYQFKHGVWSYEVVELLDKAGYRPANIFELLAFEARYPDRQRKYPIVVLASKWQYDENNWAVPAVVELEHGRYLGLIRFANNAGFSQKSRFLVIRK